MTSPAASKGALYHVYCDESRQTQDRYMVFGGIIIRASALSAFNQAMRLWRESHGMLAELKWAKVSDRKLGEYKSLVDLFFSLAGKGTLHFRSVVFDTSQIDYRTFHESDRELGFYKFFYQFLLHAFGPYVTTDADRLVVFFDQRVTRYRFSTLYVVLNRGIRKKYGRGVDAVRNIQAVVSHDCDVIQVADVLIGAVGYQNNDCHLRPGARRAKIELADYIAAKAGLLSLKQNTPWRMRHFGIWLFRFGVGKKKAP